MRVEIRNTTLPLNTRADGRDKADESSCEDLARQLVDLVVMQALSQMAPAGSASDQPRTFRDLASELDEQEEEILTAQVRLHDRPVQGAVASARLNLVRGDDYLLGKRLYVVCQRLEGMGQGASDRRRLDRWVQKWQSLAPRGIVFKPVAIGQEALEAGCCSALTLSVARRFFVTLERGFSGSIDDRLVEAIEFTHHPSKAQKMRTRQRLLNEIAYSKNDAVVLMDPLWTKIQALASVHHLGALPVSEVFSLSMKTIERLEGLIHSLGFGVYLVRTIAPCEGSDKGELYGHTQLLIKDQEGNFLYDCNIGLIKCWDNPGLSLSILLVDLWRGFEKLRDLRVYQLSPAPCDQGRALALQRFKSPASSPQANLSPSELPALFSILCVPQAASSEASQASA